MECNKDEATRAKEIAEKKFTSKDILGAKKFALKAQNLFPGLEGISQMLATLDVYISSKNMINGEADWYGILGVEPLADDETVKKHYKKLALILHPDKNKSIGADGAFRLILDAWNVLSDKAKRVAYDQKRNAKIRKVSAASGSSSVQPEANGGYNFSNTTGSRARTQKNAKSAHASTSTHKSKSNTFWTACHRCKMQFEYLRVYLNLKLLCPSCHGEYFAVETAPPPASGVRPAARWTFPPPPNNDNHQMPGKNKSNSGKKMATPNVGAGFNSHPDSYNNTNFQWTPFSKTSGVSTAAQAATVVQQAYEKVKREREEAQAATRRKEDLRRKRRASKKPSGLSSSGYSNPAKRKWGMEDASVSGCSNQAGMGNGMFGTANSSGFEQGDFESSGKVFTKPGSTRDASLIGLENLLMEKARKEIFKKLPEFKVNSVARTSVKESENSYLKANEKGEQCLKISETCDQSKIGNSEDRKSEFHAANFFAGSAVANMNAEILEAMSIYVPDADFHDFDKDRTERSFGENQVWAAYDDNDGMPRYYAVIHRVISLDPFKIRISWLHSKTNDEQGPLNWVASGFSKACGDFKRGIYEINDSLNSFSHKVRWRKGMHGVICVYPRKGDVWALYRNWSSDWNELTAYEVRHKYDMVEVLEDFSEERGVIVAPLIKVAGFKTLFHRHLDPTEVRIIPREEMFRFSHQVPSHLLTGQEAENAPKGCTELDPAALPFELLQVVKDVEEEDIVDNKDSIIEEKTEGNMEIANDDEVINDMGKFREEKEGNNKDFND